MNSAVKIVGLVLIIAALVGVRLFESNLFYDPLINFFKLDYYGLPFPEVQTGKLFVNIGLRFLLNTGLSLAVLYLVFKKRSTVALAAFVYLLVFLVLMGVLWYLVVRESTAYNTIFYVRRFLIQPILLLLLLPAFYYHKKRQ